MIPFPVPIIAIIIIIYIRPVGGCYLYVNVFNLLAEGQRDRKIAIEREKNGFC